MVLHPLCSQHSCLYSLRVSQSGSIWIGEELRAHAQFSDFFVWVSFGHKNCCQLAIFFWHRSGIVLARWHRLWHRFWHRLWHRLGIVRASFWLRHSHSQPPRARASTTKQGAISDNRSRTSHQPAINNKGHQRQSLHRLQLRPHQAATSHATRIILHRRHRTIFLLFSMDRINHSHRRTH